MSFADKKAKQAEGILKRLFQDVDGRIMSRDDILSKISNKTFHNYNPLLIEQGLVEAMYEGRAITGLRLTDKGNQIVNPTAQTQIHVVEEPAEAVVITELDKLTALTDEFNKHSKEWEWKFVRKGVQPTK